MVILNKVLLSPKIKIQEIEKLKYFFILKITPSRWMNKNTKILEYPKENS